MPSNTVRIHQRPYADFLQQSSIAPLAYDLENLFNALFFEKYNTLLKGGRDEPLYQPANHNHAEHRLFYREDFFSSALHEIAHWCIAGEWRRNQIDFAYWYESDNRSSQQQQNFLDVEIKPQALECLFSLAAQIKFNFSFDNLNGRELPIEQQCTFKKAVLDQALYYYKNGLPPRAQFFFMQLLYFYTTDDIQNIQDIITALLDDVSFSNT